MRQAGGNPLYLLELSRAVRRGAQGTGGSLDALIEQRLRALDESARDLLAWAAAMGRELRPEPLAVATGLPVAQVLARLERFTRHGLLAPTGEGHFGFTHDLVRDGVYRALSQRAGAPSTGRSRRRCTPRARPPRLHGEIVRHAALAGDAQGTARACLAAGEHCLRVFANRDAAAVAERGLSWLEDLPSGADRVALEIGLLRVRLLAVAASPGGSTASIFAHRLQRAIAAARGAGTPCLGGDRLGGAFAMAAADQRCRGRATCHAIGAAGNAPGRRGDALPAAKAAAVGTSAHATWNQPPVTSQAGCSG
jgi:hypothetical protein